MKALFKDTKYFFFLTGLLYLCFGSSSWLSPVIFSALVFYTALRSGHWTANGARGKIKALFRLLLGFAVAAILTTYIDMILNAATVVAFWIFADIIAVCLWCVVCLANGEVLRLETGDVVRVLVYLLAIAMAAALLRKGLNLLLPNSDVIRVPYTDAPLLRKLLNLPHNNLLQAQLPAWLYTLLWHIWVILKTAITLTEFYLFALLLFGQRQEAMEEAKRETEP